MKNENARLRTESRDFDIEDAIEEINERNSRKRNIIIFGLPETNQNVPPEVRQEKDKAEILSVLKTVDPEFVSDSLVPFRLGRFGDNKNRPIKLILKDEQQEG
nr:unnamed protein product [Callosobruchus chinensis]